MITQDLQANLSPSASIAEALARLLFNLSKPPSLDFQKTIYLLCFCCLASWTQSLLPSKYRGFSFHRPLSWTPYLLGSLLVLYLPIVAMISVYSPGLLSLLLIFTLAAVITRLPLLLLRSELVFLPLLALLMMLRTEIFWPVWTLTGIYLFISKQLMTHHQEYGAEPSSDIPSGTQCCAPFFSTFAKLSCSFTSLTLTWFTSALVVFSLQRAGILAGGAFLSVPLLKQLPHTQDALQATVQNLFFTREGYSMMTLAPHWLLTSIGIPALRPFIYALHTWLTGVFLLGFPVLLGELHRAPAPYQAKLAGHAVLVVTFLSCVLLNNGQLRPDSNAGLLGVGMLFTFYFVLSPLWCEQKSNLNLSLFLLFLIVSTGVYACIPNPNNTSVLLVQLFFWVCMGIIHFFVKNRQQIMWFLGWLLGVCFFVGLPLPTLPRLESSTVPIQHTTRHIEVPARFFSKRLAAVYLMFETEPVVSDINKQNFSENFSLTLNEFGLDLGELNQDKPLGFVKTRYASLKLPPFVLDSVQSKHAAEIVFEQVAPSTSLLKESPLTLIHDRAWLPQKTSAHRDRLHIPSPDLCDYSSEKALYDGDGRHLIPLESPLFARTGSPIPRVLLVGVWEKPVTKQLQPEAQCPSGPIAY